MKLLPPSFKNRQSILRSVLGLLFDRLFLHSVILDLHGSLSSCIGTNVILILPDLDDLTHKWTRFIILLYLNKPFLYPVISFTIEALF